MKESIRNYDKIFEHEIDRLKDMPISDRNKDLISKFVNECFSRGLTKGRVLKYVHYLATLASWIEKDFDTCQVEDIKRLVGLLEQSKYAEETKKEMKIYLRKLFMWLKNTDEYPPEVKWIKLNVRKSYRQKLPEDMITEDEIKRLINAAATPRDKAFIAMLYETGCRVSEMIFLRIRSLTFDKYGAIVMVPGMKTGPRRIRIISSVPLLTDWLNAHPYKDDISSYLWPTNKNETISYGYFYILLKRIAKKAGVKKKVNPHNFRHSRATYLANHLTEAQMKEYFGWMQASDMASIYVHLSGRDVDGAIMKVYGMKQEEKQEESVLVPKKCPRCERVNPSTNLFCTLCGLPLDKKVEGEIISQDMEKRKADELLDALLEKDPELKELIMKKLKERDEKKE